MKNNGLKIGDQVRFLNEVGGGRVSGFQGKDTVLVEDADGFDIPMLISEVVKTPPQPSPQGDGASKSPSCAEPTNNNGNIKSPSPVPKVEEICPRNEGRGGVIERKGGNALNIYLGFVPTNVKEISSTSFKAYLVNDSNYYISFTYLSAENAAWHPRFQGTVEPNKKMMLEEFELQDLVNLERLCIQAIAYKTDKTFALKPVISSEVRLDTVKFYKLHTFVPSPFFSSPALVYDIVRDDKVK